MNKTPQQIENDFLELKATMSEEQWSDPEYIFSCAKKFETTYPELSLRIMRRVRRLNNQLTKKLQKEIARKEDDIPNNKKEEDDKADIKDTKNQIGTAPSRHEETIKKQNKSSDTEAILNKSWFDTIVTSQVYKKPLFLIVILPWLLFFIYQTLVASPRYVSQSQLIVEQPDRMATMDTGMALLSGLGVKPTGTDAELVKAFIHSGDLIDYLDEKINLKKHYTDSGADLFSRLSKHSSREAFYSYYKNHVEVTVDQKSQVINITTQAFTPEFSKLLNESIVERAEWYINQISNKLAEEQLNFIENEHQLVEERIKDTKKRLLEFQNKYGLLDPEAEGMAIQKIAYSIESLLAQKQAELKTLTGVMNETAPQVTSIKNEIKALEEQLRSERDRLSDTNSGESVSEIMSKFVDFKVDMELALQAYSSSQISLEKSRVEAYRQIKYLVIVQTPTLAEDNAYPNVSYNIALFAVVLLMLFGIGKIIYSTIHEISK